MFSKLAILAAPLLAAGVAEAQLAGLRGTIPGSLHQCESTNMFFFDSDNSRPLTVLFLPSAEVPDSARTGTVQLTDAASYSPLQVIENIDSADAAEFDFTLQIEEGTAFEVFAFLSDGSGKALSLTRTVTTPLPNASSCLNNVQTTVSGVAAAAAVTTSSSSSASRSTSSSSSSSSSTSTSATSTRSTSSTSARSTAASSTLTTTIATTASPAANTDPAVLSSIAAAGAASRSAVTGVAVTLLAAVAALMASM